MGDPTLSREEEEEQQQQLFNGAKVTECVSCGEPLDSVEQLSIQHICFACAMLREE